MTKIYGWAKKAKKLLFPQTQACHTSLFFLSKLELKSRRGDFYFKHDQNFRERPHKKCIPSKKWSLENIFAESILYQRVCPLRIELSEKLDKKSARVKLCSLETVSFTTKALSVLFLLHCTQVIERYTLSLLCSCI